MPLSHLLLALAVVSVWGTNFVVIKWGLAELPPFLLAALRFTAASLPWVFFLRRPAASWGRLAVFGVLLGAGQFGLLYLAMRADVTPGLASLIMQSQVFFTIAMAMVIQRERLGGIQAFAMLLAVAGIALIGWHAVSEGGASITLHGLGLLLAASFAWALANMVVRGAGRVDALAFIVWSSPFAVPPLLALSFWSEGGATIAAALHDATWVGWATVAWQAVGNMLFGYAAWNWLLARHPAATVTPTALLVPVFGMAASAWLLGEPLQAWKLVAAVLVIGGLALNLQASRFAAWAQRIRSGSGAAPHRPGSPRP